MFWAVIALAFCALSTLPAIGMGKLLARAYEQLNAPDDPY